MNNPAGAFRRVRRGPSTEHRSLPRCRPPPRELAGGRRSKPSPRFFAVGVTCSRCAARSGADRRSAFQAVPALFRGWRFALSLRGAQRCRPGRRAVPASAFALRAGAARRSRASRLLRSTPRGGAIPECSWGPSAFRRPPLAGCAGPHRENWRALVGPRWSPGANTVVVVANCGQKCKNTEPFPLILRLNPYPGLGVGGQATADPAKRLPTSCFPTVTTPPPWM